MSKPRPLGTAVQSKGATIRAPRHPLRVPSRASPPPVDTPPTRQDRQQRASKPPLLRAAVQRSSPSVRHPPESGVYAPRMRRELPKTVPLGEVIASRRLKLKGKPKARAELRIGAPVRWDGDAYCPVQLVGIGDERVKPVWGVGTARQHGRRRSLPTRAGLEQLQDRFPRRRSPRPVRSGTSSLPFHGATDVEFSRSSPISRAQHVPTLHTALPSPVSGGLLALSPAHYTGAATTRRAPEVHPSARARGRGRGAPTTFSRRSSPTRTIPRGELPPVPSHTAPAPAWTDPAPAGLVRLNRHPTGKDGHQRASGHLRAGRPSRLCFTPSRLLYTASPPSRAPVSAAGRPAPLSPCRRPYRGSVAERRCADESGRPRLQPFEAHRPASRSARSSGMPPSTPRTERMGPDEGLDGAEGWVYTIGTCRSLSRAESPSRARAAPSVKAPSSSEHPLHQSKHHRRGRTATSACPSVSRGTAVQGSPPALVHQDSRVGTIVAPASTGSGACSPRRHMHAPVCLESG